MNLPLVSILTQMNLAHTLRPYYTFSNLFRDSIQRLIKIFFTFWRYLSVILDLWVNVGDSNGCGKERCWQAGDLRTHFRDLSQTEPDTVATIWWFSIPPLTMLSTSKLPWPTVTCLPCALPDASALQMIHMMILSDACPLTLQDFYYTLRQLECN